MENLYSKYLSTGGVVTTDSRSIKGGEMFFALKGENFDGNAYAMKALEAGAAWAVVNEGTEAAASGDPRIIPVSDTFKTLTELANWHRNHFLVDGERLKVIGLTGTNGKTTTKELIRSVLSVKYVVTATEGNLNNDIGVPLSILKIRKGTQLAVIEMGANHPDDIAKLVKVSEPDFGLITNVGKAHLLGFGSFEGVKQAKGELYKWVSSHGGHAFVNADDENLMEMAGSMLKCGTTRYGVRYQDATVLTATPEHPFVRIEVNGNTVCTNLVGAYNAMNVMAALCVGEYFGVPFDAAAAAIESFVPANNRSQMMKTERNILIVDAYNANPSSMAVAIDNFAGMQAPAKLALLGDMRELGDDSVKEHVSVLKRVQAAGFDAIFVGEEFDKAQKETGTSFRWFPDSQALADYLKDLCLTGVTLLVKGSRGIQMEKAIPSL